MDGSYISHLQRSQIPTKDASSSIESIEISIQTLIKSWCRRQKYWQLFFNPTKHDINNQVIRATWRIKLINFLESTPIRVISIILILLDLILTILDLSSSLISCMPNKTNGKILAGYYHWVGIGILIILCTKTMALAIGLGFSWFGRPGYVVDGVVLSGALVMEVLLERKGGGLLVVVSLWRVLRVVESAFELSDQAIEAQIETIICQFDGLKDENRRFLEIIAEKDKMIKNLEEDLDQCV